MNSKSWKTDEEEEAEKDDSKSEKESMAKEVFTRVNPIFNFNLPTTKDKFAFQEGSNENSTHSAHEVGKRHDKKKEKDLKNLNVLEGKRTPDDGEEASFIIEEEYHRDESNSGTGSNNPSLKDEQKDLTKGHSAKMLVTMLNMERTQTAQLENIQKTQMRTIERQDVMETDLEEIKKTSMRVESTLERWKREFSMQHAIPKPVIQRGDNLRIEDICTSLHCPCPCRHRPALSDHRNNSGQDKIMARRRKQLKTSTGGDGGGSSGDDSSSESDDGEYKKWSGKAPRNIPVSIKSRGKKGGGGDGGPSDSSSSEIDNHSRKAWSDKSRRNKNSRDKWKDAIDQKDECVINGLIERERLPDYSLLKRACLNCGRNSRVVKVICDVICRVILKTNENIISVVPTYRLDCPHDITFLVNMNEHTTDNISFRDFPVVVRVSRQYNSEGKVLAGKEDGGDCSFTETDLQVVANCIRKKSEKLFKHHSNLQMISPSHFKSSFYGQENASCERRMCIVFYVSVKGFIPLTEEQFPVELDGIPTDVREGGFNFLSNAKDSHANIKMGCAISGDSSRKYGTIGPFFEEGENIYFLTSSHILYDLSIIPKDVLEYDWQNTETTEGPSANVYQPLKSLERNNPIGKVYCAFYKKGNDDKPGMEIAVVKITDLDRKPVSGVFPDSGNEPMETSEDNTAQRNPSYESGAIADKDFISNNCCVGVLKFGAETGMTKSRVNNFCTSVRGVLADNDGETVLLNQLEILEKHDGVEFAGKGDSGSLILASVHGDLRALGLLVGKASTGRVIATPVYAILDELARFGLSRRSFINFHRQPITQVSTDSGIGPSSPTDTFDAVNQSISQDVAKHSYDNKIILAAEMKPRFEAIETDVTDLKGKVSGLDKKVSNIDANLASLDMRVSNLDTKFSSIDSKSSSMMDMLGKILENQNKK